MSKKWMELALPAVVIACIVVIYSPLPAALMDFLLVANITVSVVLLLTALFARSSLELSVFPALLLVTTLARLALNVATTRLILTRAPIDHESAAGEVIRSFGLYVAGDQLAVGLIIFAILFIVQFVVITKGCVRIGEVSARFALDGLPGRQMAIDADLNSGAITHEEARQHRRELLRFADFHGAMDGASKYVRGDAIAGLVIVLVNLFGGLAFGIYHGMSVGQAAETFSKLTIGDGLASQVPALLTSIAAGLLVSRGSDESNLPRDAVSQLISSPIVLAVTAAFLLSLLFTQLPKLPLLGMAAICAAVFWKTRKTELVIPGRKNRTVMSPETSLEKLLETDALEVQVGAGLIALADVRQGGTLLTDISEMRKRLAGRLGIVLPKVRIRDNLKLSSRSFRILFNGDLVTSADIPVDSKLLTGVQDPGPRERCDYFSWAQQASWWAGSRDPDIEFTKIFNAAQIIAETVYWVAFTHADDLLNRDATVQLLDETRKTHPAIVAEVENRAGSTARIQRILKALVREGVSLRPFQVILEAISEVDEQADDGRVIEHVRLRVRRQICQRLRNAQGVIKCFGLSDELQQVLRSSFGHSGEQEAPILTPAMRQSLVNSIEIGCRHMRSAELPPVLLVAQELRPELSDALQHLLPELNVLGTLEIDGETKIDTVARILLSDIKPKSSAA